ncbi:energy transducer TonB [Desulfobulbus sp.]|uniref:energy transducer TonB n=1 Tax=Desulfobulbus sp. TaxID=895 RepID=UPI0027B98CFC|nr:energy transducer TonB [Desulfobulbus sp.]
MQRNQDTFPLLQCIGLPIDGGRVSSSDLEPTTTRPSGPAVSPAFLFPFAPEEQGAVDGAHSAATGLRDQSKAARYSLLLHAVVVLAAFLFSHYADQTQPPPALDCSIIMTGSTTALAGDAVDGGDSADGADTADAAQQSPPVTTVPKKTVVAAKKAITQPAPHQRKIVPKFKEPSPPADAKQPIPSAITEQVQEVERSPLVAKDQHPESTAASASLSPGSPGSAGSANSAANNANAAGANADAQSDAEAGAHPGATAKSGQGQAAAKHQGANGGGLFTAGQLDGPLTALTKTPPVYPRAAKQRNTEGWIKVKFVVNEQGHVDQVTILDAEPKDVFEQSVLRCMHEWRFKPGTVGGRAVKALVEQTISFKLQ